MSETTINALATIFMVALLVFITAVVVIGGVTLIWVMVTDLINAIRERRERGMKYIIEIKPEYEDKFRGIMILGAENSNLYVDSVAVDELEELNSDYINEHFGDLQDTAYQRGLEDGKQTAVGAAELREKLEYQKGLEDAWECARELFSSMADSDIEKAFPIEWNNGGFHALINLQPQEAIAKLKAYEEKQKADDEIKVGDVVMIKQFKHPENHRFVVTKVSDESVWGVEGDGSWNYWAINEVIKTDKHFDIQKILEGMK